MSLGEEGTLWPLRDAADELSDELEAIAEEVRS
jgi:hypothetical protein